MQSKRKKRTRIRAAKVTSGHGHKKKNRGAGHRGGRGRAGSGKRGDSKIMKVTGGVQELGKKGFTSLKNRDNVINVRQLDASVHSLFNQKKVVCSDGVYNIDLKSLGYDKLLSKGDISFKVHVTVSKATAKAIEKIKNAGGVVVLDSQVPVVKNEGQ